MRRDYEKMSAYQLIMAGLQEAIRHCRGELTLRTTKRAIGDPNTTSFFQRLKKGMEESIAYSRGEKRLRTTTVSTRVKASERTKRSARTRK
jgi:hypothetical protein